MPASVTAYSAEELSTALSKAKIQLMTKADSVFFTTLCFSLRHRFEEGIRTAATDGKQIMFNPGFFMRLDTEERIFLMLHETMHCAYRHMVRTMGRDKSQWNIACDHAINLQLIARGFKMPVGGLADRAYDGMGAEQIYLLLPPPPQGDPDPDFGVFGEDLVPCEGDSVSNEVEQSIQDALVRASIQSRISSDKPGTIPGEIEIFLNKLLNPKLPWQRILSKYMQKFAKNDYSFRKPNRRFLPKHYLPSLYSEALIDMAIAIDTSGSVSDEEFHRAISEIGGIMRMMKPAKMTLIQFDTEIKAIDTIGSFSDLMNIKFTGRGGTQIEPVLEWAEKNKPQLLMFFSDGRFTFYKGSVNTETLWLIHSHPEFTPPFGKTIHYTC